MNDYFREKLERELDFYKGQAAKVDDAYRAEVERLASKMTDPVLADFTRKTVRPERITSEVNRIRDLLEVGDIVAADRALEYLKRTLDFVESRLQRRYFAAGLAASLAGREGPQQRARGKAHRNTEMVRQYLERESTSNLSRSALKADIGKRHGVRRAQAIKIIDDGLTE